MKASATDEPRLFRTTVRLTAAEHRHLKEQADVAGLSLSGYARSRILGHSVASKADLKVLAELRRLGGLLKHIHLETRGAYSADTADAIKAIESYVRNFRRDKNGG